MNDEISFDDCCRIILEDWRWRQDGVAGVLRDYKRALLAMLNSEFGISWRDGSRMEGLPAVVSTMPRGYAGLVSPLADWLEYRPIRGEQKVLDRHTSGLRDAEMAIKQHWVALFRDLLLLRWPKAAHRRSSWARLRELGLGDPVDELDLF